MNKYEKYFAEQYKDMRITSGILIIGGLVFLIVTILSEWLDKVSPIIITFGSLLIFYGILIFYSYWISSKYIKNKKAIPKWLKIFTAIFSMFYLTFYQLDENEKKYRFYLLTKELRFYFIWTLIITLLFGFSFLFINNNFYWLSIGLYILNYIILIIEITLSIFIWKNKRTQNKLLKIFSIITLSYRNYQLYKKITELNIKNKPN